MNLPHPISVKELARKIGATKILGDDSLLATGINEIHKVREGDIAFSDNEKYFAPALQSEATILILNQETDCPEGKAILVCAEPFQAYNNLVKEFRPFEPLTTRVSEKATIDPTAIIEPNAIIGHHVTIGAHSHIQSGAFIGDYTVIGSHVNVHAGAMVGTNAFYYKRTDDKRFLKWHTGGRVVIEDHVEIGAACTINAGVSGDTFIGEGTKFDSQIHIGHDAVVGRHCLFAAQVGIGGNTIIGDHVVLYGQVGIAQNLVIGDHVVVLAQSGISRNLKPGVTYFGSPAEEVKVKYKQLAAMRQLPEIAAKWNSKNPPDEA